LANLEETLQKQAAAFAEVESLRRQKAELEAELTKNNEKLASLKHALASAQEVLSSESLTPTAKVEPEASEGSEMLSGIQAACPGSNAERECQFPRSPHDPA